MPQVSSDGIRDRDTRSSESRYLGWHRKRMLIRVTIRGSRGDRR